MSYNPFSDIPDKLNWSSTNPFAKIPDDHNPNSKKNSKKSGNNLSNYPLIYI